MQTQHLRSSLKSMDPFIQEVSDCRQWSETELIIKRGFFIEKTGAFQEWFNIPWTVLHY